MQGSKDAYWKFHSKHVRAGEEGWLRGGMVDGGVKAGEGGVEPKRRDWHILSAAHAVLDLKEGRPQVYDTDMVWLTT